MFNCRICKFGYELDDVAVGGAISVICVRCYARETGTEIKMPKPLRRSLSEVLDSSQA